MLLSWSFGAIVREFRRAACSRNPKVILAVTIAAAACGAGAGWLIGRVISQQRAEMIADQFVLRIHTVVKAALHEEYEVIQALDGSHYPHCSDAGLAWMRKLILKSDYLSEAGRMEGSQIVCSASMGRVVPSGKEFTPDLVLRNGIKVYLNPEPYQRPNMTIIVARKGDWFVVFRPTVEAFFASAPMRFVITRLDSHGNPMHPTMGTLTDAPAWIASAERKTLWKNTIFATRCDQQGATCITASISLHDAMQYGHFGVGMTIAMGAIMGALFSLLFSFLNRQNGALEWKLRQAIRADKLYVAYMPIVDLNSRRVVGAEALVRWEDEEGQPIPPDIFIQLAEERGFVSEITEFVVRQVLNEFGAHLRNHCEFSINVNVTASDFANPGFLTMLNQHLEDAGVAPQSLTVEITESSTARHGAVRDMIRQLRGQGYRVHIDDFGTGYSSLAYLHELSVDAIKIDKSFTQAIGTEAVTVTILPQIMAMADALGLEVVVEGIETEEQASYFADLSKPRLAQGWLFGAPVPALHFADLHIDQEIPIVSQEIPIGSLS